MKEKYYNLNTFVIWRPFFLFFFSSSSRLDFHKNLMKCSLKPFHYQNIKMELKYMFSFRRYSLFQS